MPPKKEKWYAYFVPPHRTGVTADWKLCESMVKGVPGARYKSFTARRDADAWLAGGAKYEARPSVAVLRTRLVPGIYFDAGTGRGKGVEVSVTDERGTNLLHEAVPSRTLNAFGKHLLDDPAATNNYGELLALRYALEIAQARGAVRVFGDSKLVIEYWSKWRIKRNEVAPETVALAETVARMREAFEAGGGTVERISGDDNPADLGFHS
jgi:ribonuclease HI